MTSITPAQLKELLAIQDDLMIIDIREPWEFEEYNIGGMNIPLNSIPLKLDELEPFKNIPIIICCSIGDRSDTARQFLKSQGFSNVRNLTGGFVAWKNLVKT